MQTVFRAYGLAWRLADVHGFKEVSHTGTVAGMKSYVVMMPELELGVVLLTNGSSSAARSSVMNSIVRSFMPVRQIDWIQLALDEREAAQQAEHLEENKPAENTEPSGLPEFSEYIGRYRDPWFGDVTISLEGGQLVFSAVKSPGFHGEMRHLKGNRFVVRWIDQSLEADAYVLFDTDRNNTVTGISMTKKDDGDFDFEDLDLTKVK